MKTTKALFALIFVFLLNANHLLAQDSNGQPETTKEKSSIKEVDKINQASGEINETSANTAEAVKGTVSNTKETLKELGSLFGSGKEKVAKGVINIGIQPITYDDPNLNALYEQITEIRGVKNPNKNFRDNSVTITAEYKDGADALWQNVTTEVRAAFKMVQMGNDMIVVQPAD
ncbi:hypothetical protein ZORO111903_06280 [Zobellia roscoffensis]|uniref:hypothetical protein n=1 Tax=Zobellia roscoffensis TaxID=2779508 RepID=UPI00188B2E0C|nr:hypothetical protein [Zobellia roscoffensis]